MILELQLPGAASPCLLCVCYRPAAEGNPGWERIKASITAALATNLSVLAVGDFNARSQEFGSSTNCPFGTNLAAYCDDNGLTGAQFRHLQWTANSVKASVQDRHVKMMRW